MTRKFTEDEVLSVTQSLRTKPSIISRRDDQSAEDIVASLVDFVYRSLNSDTDSVYALIKLFVAEQVVLCGEIISHLSELYELAPSVNKALVEVDTRSLSAVQLLAQQAFFNTGEQRKRDIEDLRSQIQSFSRTLPSGRSPQYAKTRSLTLLTEVVTKSIALHSDAERFHGIVKDYMQADFESTLEQGQLARTTEALELLGSNMLDPAEAKLVSAVVDSMLGQYASSKRDIRLPKYSGKVTLLPGNPAALYGATLPLIIQDAWVRTATDIDEEVSLEHADSTTQTTETLVAPLAGKPSLVTRVSPGVFKRMDSGVLVAATSELPVAGPITVRSTDILDGSGNSAQTLMHFSSVGYDNSQNPAQCPSVVFCPFLKTYVSPNSVVISFSTVSAEVVQAHNMNQADFVAIFEQVLTTASHTVTDDGYGSIRDGGDNVIGTIDYNTGEFVLNSPSGDDFDVRVPVVVQYEYQPLRDGRHFNGVSGGLIADGSYEWWNTFSVWDGNNVGVGQLSGINSTSTLKDAISDICPVSMQDSVFTFRSRYGGTASRISFPHSGATPALNTAAFAPNWDTPPISFNGALGMTLSAVPEVYGRDTDFSLIQDPSASVLLGVNRELVLSTIQLDYKGAATLEALDDLSSVLVGDDLHVTDPVNCHTKVVSVDGNTVTVYPDIPLRILSTTVPSVEDTLSISAKITRNTLVIQSKSDDPHSAITVSDAGLGFSGTATASTSRVHLGNDLALTNVITSPGYSIKAGDVVVESNGDLARPIGTVSSISGNEVTLSMTASQYVYPYDELEIYSLGWSRYKMCAAPIYQASVTLYDQLYKQDLFVKAVSFLNSGSGQNAFYQAILTLRDNIGALRNLYLKYDAHTVTTAGALIEHFRQDKISAFAVFIERCKFSEISEMTPETLVAKSSVEELLGQATSMLGGDISYWSHTTDINMFDDYQSESDHPRQLARLRSDSFSDIEE